MIVTTRHRMQAREALINWHRKTRPLVPKCGAKTRAGHPCGIIALKNGRCWRHGGRTGKGYNWHRLRWPKDGPAAELKLQRKLAVREKTAKERAARIAAMTPEERERHESWQRTHRSGPPAARAEKRRQREQNADIAAVVAKERLPVPASIELQIEIDALERRLAAVAGANINIFD